jgi:uncharacterized protein YjbI with pentapeptide repeats
MSNTPEIKDDPMYQLLRADKIDEFNARRAKGESCDLRGVDLRNLDLRGMNAEGLDMRDCYFRQTDLRGVDLTSTQLAGSSLKGAKISGTFFPPELSAEEINLSLQHGTRLRYR